MPADTFWKSRPLIEAAILRNAGISRASLVNLLGENGIPPTTAYRHVSRYYRGVWGQQHLPTQQEVLVRVTMALERDVERILAGEKGSLAASTRLLLEAHGILDVVVDDGMSEKDRLAAAAVAIAALRGAQPQASDRASDDRDELDTEET